MNDKSIKILGIETSCDETAAAIVTDGRRIAANIINSQIDIHKTYGGVVPEIASRNHISNITNVVDAAISSSLFSKSDISAVAVTYAPGLVGSLLVGVSFAKALAYSLSIPIIAVHHISGHISSNYLESSFEPPFICLVISGGHTLLVKVEDYGNYTTLGSTLDDALGETYDKIARSLGLTYPGGAKLEALASVGNKEAIRFPRAYLSESSLNFSFSGLKSSVLNYINKTHMKGEDLNIKDIAASFQEAALEVIVNKAITACKITDLNKLALAGGVASNHALRDKLYKTCASNGISLNVPLPLYCTDNAAMIASAGYYEFIKNRFANLNLNAISSLSL